jgi:flagellar biosynthesis/type III secretory pathway protein FliH
MTGYKDKWCQEAYNKGFKEGRDFEKGQLAKAKNILNNFLNACEDYEISEARAEAEQFLKEE